MLGIHDRLAELWTIQKKRSLSELEMKEWVECLNFHENYFRKLSKLKNLSYAAYLVNDIDWQHEICANIEKLDMQYNVGLK